MATYETRHIQFAHTQLELGKSEAWIVEALIQQKMELDAAQDLVARVLRGLEAKRRHRRRSMAAGLVLLVPSVAVLFLGLGFKRTPPVFPDLFPAGSNIPVLFLIPSIIGAFMLFHGMQRGKVRLPRPSPEKVLPGQIAPGWPKIGTRRRPHWP